MTDPTTIYLDNHLFVVDKPAGMLAQGDRTRDKTLLDWAKAYIKTEFNKPGNVFLGLVHRLDRPTSGVIALARTSKAASRLSEQFRMRKVRKVYWTIVEGKVPDAGILEDRIARHNGTSKINADGKAAVLQFRLVRYHRNFSWLEIDLGTGRHHQIRVQLANQGHPVVGDFRYGSKQKFPGKSLALHSRSLSVKHPVKSEIMRFTAETPTYWQTWFDKSARRQ